MNSLGNKLLCTLSSPIQKFTCAIDQNEHPYIASGKYRQTIRQLTPTPLYPNEYRSQSQKDSQPDEYQSQSQKDS